MKKHDVFEEMFLAACERLDIELEKTVYTVGELDKLSEEMRCSVYDLMAFLRWGR